MSNQSLLVWVSLVIALFVSGCRKAGTCGEDGHCKQGQRCCQGECKDVGDDVDHCGACGVACSRNNASPLCQGGVCRVGACEPDFGDCNGDSRDGCEASLLTAANACGSCAVACMPRNADGVCTAGQCGMGSCQAGYADCDGSAATGCEVNTSSEARHCGACGRVCAPPRAQGVCRNSVCRVGTCEERYGDCNSDPQDGCETPLQQTDAHCGACNRACPADQACLGGECRFRELILFGGAPTALQSPVGQTFRFDVGTKKFVEITSPNGPAARFGHSAIWDAAGKRMLVYGGYDRGLADAAVHALTFDSDPPVWSTLTTTGTSPGVRHLHAAAFDRTGRKWYVFGGWDEMSTELGDLLVLDVSTLVWSKLTPGGTAPTPRVGAAATFDAKSGKLFIFGGSSFASNVEYADLWTVEPGAANPTWTKVVLPGGPPALTGAAFADGASPLALFGGMTGMTGNVDYTVTGELWLLSLDNPSRWTRQTATPAPMERWLPAAAMLGSQVLIFGGETFVGGSLIGRSDLWRYDPAAMKWTELIGDGTPGAPKGMSGATMVARE